VLGVLQVAGAVSACNGSVQRCAVACGSFKQLVLRRGLCVLLLCVSQIKGTVLLMPNGSDMRFPACALLV
jgi:hypothetical protein